MGTNTGIGIGIGIPFKNNALGGDRPYLPPELKARLIGVWDNYGKKNTDADRNIIKNKIPNAGGDLEILNAAYKLNSGFGEYREDFTSWRVSKEPMTVEKTDSQVHISYIGTSYKKLPMFEYSGPINENYSLTVEIQGIPNNVIGKFIHNNGFTQEVTNGINTIKFSNSGSWYGFTFYREDNTIIGDCNITIKQIPAFEGALVTDGINDIIASIKTLEDWNIGNKGITIVSMIHQINTNTNNFITTNNIRTDNKVIGRNIVSNIEKTGIYGWYKENIQSDTINVINNILGDKNDYTSHSSPSTNINPINNSKFYVQGYAIENGFAELSSVAHYWTFAVLGKATEDEINLIIAKYNLDRTLRPDILCNITKQGITNDNHADFNDKLVDYSGNGRDIQMYNLAWKGSSGVAAKKFETIKDYLIVPDEGLQELTIYNEFSYKVKSIKHADRYWTIQTLNKTDVSYPITIVSDKNIIWRNAINYTDENGVKRSIRKETNVPANTPTQVFVLGFNDFDVPDNYTKVNCVAYATRTDITEFTVIFIPSCKGGILLDGINDFGKVIDMPIYKDYTFIIDREIISIGDISGIVASKSESSTDTTKQGAFLFECLRAPNNISTWSFYNDNHEVGETDFTKSISYQSKYSYNGKELTAGEAKDSDKLWLGTIRDKDSRFFNGAIYSLMSFPYSMSKFLIERQLKKYKLGTLYPDMVEFRPIVKSNNKWDIIEIWQGDKSLYRPTINDDKTGIYLKKDSTINIYVKPYVGQKVSEIVYNGVSYTNLKLNSNGFYYITVPVTKSPQKIGITIEQDENYILFNPVINSNYDNYKLTFHLREYEKLINIGDYIPKGTFIRANLYLKNNIDELVTFTFNGVNIGYRRSTYDDTTFNIRQIYNYDSPQEVNITIDEYIRYEDIVQPYPVIFQITDRNTNQRYSWGDKIKVGSSIRLSQGEKPNLLSGLYSIQSYEYEGETYSYNQLTNLNIILTKQSISLSCNKTWLLDDNEPKCILSPRLLRIPNSSYKILGYIPDISGHGNHGVIHNSAYAEMSGANGYGTNLGNWSINSANTGKIITQREEHLEYEVLSADKNILFYNTKIENDTFVIYTSVNTNIVYSKESDIIANIPANTPTKVVCPKIGTILLKTNETPTVGNIITVKQYGIYEGAYCFDGVDDFVTIPTTVGGKQVLMKVNWDDVIANAIIYDQRGYPDEFAIYNADKDNSNNPVFAYQARNTGQTYIDGILNSNIKASELKAITHNITITNELSAGVNKSSPVIGSNIVHNDFFVNMALYDFMLFDEISTEAKIKELNTYIGITPKVTLPNYYWDNYGKKNTDANRGYVDEQVSLQKTGTSVNPLENFNISYEGMSGYNGYPVVFGASKTWESLSGVYGYISDVTNTTIHVTHVEHAGHGLLFSYVKKDGALINIKEIPAFRVTIGGLEGNSKLGYRYLATEDATEETLVYLGNGTHELAKSFAPTEALLDLTRNAWVGIFITPMIESEIVFDCDITIEVLPEYENGLAYDGVSDFSQNTEIEVVEDFTFLVKGSLLKGFTGSGGCIARKGDKKHYNTGGYAFIYCFDSPIESYRNSYYSFGKSFVPSKEIVAPPLIGYMTKTNVNGETTTFGTNSDIKGIIFGNRSSGYMNMVIYKSIFYTKTISLLEINFLKNLMEKDEIIDINHPIFISNTEDESNTSQDT